MSSGFYAIGTETIVNASVTGYQRAPFVKLLDSNRYVVAWISNELNEDDKIIYQIYGVDGKKIGPEVKVSTKFYDHLLSPSVEVLSDGGYVFVWGIHKYTGGTPEYDYDIVMRQYNADGTPRGGETTVNTTPTGRQTDPSIVALKDGGYVITWTASDQDGSGEGIYQQIYNADGSKRGGEIRVNTETADYQYSADSAALKDGSYAVVWVSKGQDGSGSGIYQQIYNADGSKRGGETRVNTTTIKDQYEPAVTALKDGGYVVTWLSSGQDGSGSGIYQQVYNADGSKRGGETRVNTTTANDQSEARAAALSDGGYVVTWTSCGQDGSKNGIYQQAFNADGSKRGGETPVNVVKTGDQTSARTLMLPDGSLVTVWVSDHETSADAQIYLQRLKANQAPSDAQLNGASIGENAANGTAIGTVSGQDVNIGYGDALTYTLIDNAGGRFYLDGTTLRVANGALLDYEAATSHTIVVRVSDRDQSYIDRVFTIQVGDVAQENLAGTNSANALYGTGGHEWIYGYGGNDTLSGGAGDDRLFGGTGKDRLTGGAGKDAFVFNSKPNKKTNLDKITDFNVKDDSIWLDNNVFKALGKKGTEAKPAQLKKSFFKTFDKTHPLNQDANDYVLYNKSTGALYYDADGAGGKAAVQIATLSKKLKLTYKDFFVI